MVIQATPSSIVTGIQWPGIPDPKVGSVLSVLWQLEQTQWWPVDRLVEAQRGQLTALLQHAVTTVPLYRERYNRAGVISANGTFESARWEELPILGRAELIAGASAIMSRAYPGSHGETSETFTSRTSGEPVRVLSTGVTQVFWQAITLRDHTWHRRDLDAHLAAIRHAPKGGADAPDGARSHGWGQPTASLAPNAPVSLLSISTPTEDQLRWLVREDPSYLLIYPSALDALLVRMAERGIRLTKLREVRTIGEAVNAETRTRVNEVLGVPLVDTYSAQEVGYIALQCPSDPGCYHVQSECVLVEILRDDGQPCAPGEVGRVIVTDLHNFATPIVRYEIGDYAEAGEPCRCGRGLPTLRRIVGRRRGMLRYPDGRTVWPVFTVACRLAARYQEIQLIQERIDLLRLRVVADAALTEQAKLALTHALQDVLGHPFEIAIEQVAELSRTRGGKLEEFVSLVT